MRNPFAARPTVHTFELGPDDLVVLVNERRLTPAQYEYAKNQLDIAIAKRGAVKSLVLDSGWQINIIKRKGSDNAAT